MSTDAKSATSSSSPVSSLPPRGQGIRIFMWPKVIFLYPTAIVALLCVVLGWSAIPLMGTIRAATGMLGLGLLLGGGALYSLGALAYALRRPNPVPGVFGYHEVFHALVVLASVCHFGVEQAVVRAL